MSEGDVNLHFFEQGTKTAQLTCNWCHEHHAVEPEYRTEILERGKEKLEGANITDIDVEDTWTCGKCLLVLHGLAADDMPTDCHNHEVPEKQ